MKQVIGTLIFLLITASAWAQNAATVLQNTKAKAQSVQEQTQTHSSATPVKVKAPVHAVTPAVKPVAQKSAPTKAAPVAPSAKAIAVAQRAKPVPAVQAKSVPVQKPQVALKPVAMKPVAMKSTAMKPVAMKPAVIALKPVAVKAPTKTVPSAKAKAPVVAKPTAVAKVDVKDTNAKPEGSEKEKKESEKDKKEDETSSKLISGVGKRDPFVSPVVAQSMSGSGCSVGKKCLAIDQITIRGVVKSDSGMIAVVVNALDKAYFLRENDPVFNGYVEKITEDSIIFKEMYQDKLGKSFTRDVTKRIQAPVV
jgi:Tfp pilus assembly protein PilP